MKQRTTRRNDSIQFLTKHCYNCIYLLSIAFILNGLILEAYAKASLNTKGWQFSSQFDQVFFCYLICLNLKWYANAYKKKILFFKYHIYVGTPQCLGHFKSTHIAKNTDNLKDCPTLSKPNLCLWRRKRHWRWQ